MAETIKQENQIKDLERLRAFRLMDDDFMTAVFQGDNEVTQYVLQILLEDAALKVLHVDTQHSIKNLMGGRSIRMDVRAIDAHDHLRKQGGTGHYV